jgi:hypothetical protein
MLILCVILAIYIALIAFTVKTSRWLHGKDEEIREYFRELDKQAPSLSENLLSTTERKKETDVQIEERDWVE